jgi:hypothetical protein
MTQTVVRYRVKPDQATENARLAAEVYEGLAEAAPEGFRYASFALENGVSFVHVAIQESEGPFPLSDLPAFKRFRVGLDHRCAEGPFVMKAELVGSYGFGL